VQAPQAPVEQPQQMLGAGPAAAPKPWNMQSAWSKDIWPVGIIKPATDSEKSFSWKERTYYQSDKSKATKDAQLNIYKGQAQMAKYDKAKPTTLARRTYYATKPNTMLWELQDHAMSWAVSIGATGLKVNSEFYQLKSTQTGGGFNAAMMASILTSVLSNAALVGPTIGGNWQTYNGVMDVYPTLDVEAVQ
jgi:hypothetical protein